MNAVHEVLARRGRPIIVCSAGDDEAHRLAYRAVEVPATVDCLQGVINVVPLQLLAFHLAVLNHHDVRTTSSLLFLFSPYCECTPTSQHLHLYPRRWTARATSPSLSLSSRPHAPPIPPHTDPLLFPTRLSSLNPCRILSHIPRCSLGKSQFHPCCFTFFCEYLTVARCFLCLLEVILGTSCLPSNSSYPATHLYTIPNLSRIRVDIH